MSNELAPLYTEVEEKKELIKSLYCKTLTEPETQHFFAICHKRRLNPLTNQIYVWKFGQKMTIIVSIDGFRLIAERTKSYAPGKETTFAYKNDGSLLSATAYVKKRTVDGTWHEVPSTAFFDEFNDPKKDTWRKMPHVMIAKCLPYRAIIETDLGSFPIGEIVNKMLPVKVRSINFETGIEEWKEVIGWIRNTGTIYWRKIILPTNNRGSNSIITTEDHKIYTENGWKKASEIRKGDMIAVSSCLMSEDQKQVILGSLMGDGSLYVQNGRTDRSCPFYSEAHSEKQLDYILWKFRGMKNFSPKIQFYDVKVKGVEHKTIKFRTQTSPCFYEFHKKFYQNKKKQVSRESVSLLDDLGVAVWLMDDGNIRRSGASINCKPIIRLYTCCFENQNILVDFFAEKYGIEPKILREEKNPYLSFSVDQTEELLKRLSKYIVFDQETNDKKWIAEDIHIGRSNSFCFVPCIESLSFVSRGIKSRDGKPQSEGRYDITVKDNHNFLYNNVVVHNCAEANALRRAFPEDLSGMYTQEEMDHVEEERSDQVTVEPEVQEDITIEKACQTISSFMGIENNDSLKEYVLACKDKKDILLVDLTNKLLENKERFITYFEAWKAKQSN